MLRIWIPASFGDRHTEYGLSVGWFWIRFGRNYMWYDDDIKPNPYHDRPYIQVSLFKRGVAYQFGYGFYTLRG